MHAGMEVSCKLQKMNKVLLLVQYFSELLESL